MNSCESHKNFEERENKIEGQRETASNHSSERSAITVGMRYA